MWLFKVFGVMYIAAVCASQDLDASTYSYAKSTQPTTTLYVPPRPNLQLTSAQVEFFRSEKVELRCSVTNILELTFTWKKDGNPLVSGPNLSWSPDKSVLTITASSQQDSGGYSCAVKSTTKPSQTTESNVVSVQVDESKPKPTLTRDSNLGEMFPGESIIFTCRVSVSSGWEYLWYRGEQEIKIPNTDMYSIPSISLEDKGQYHCKARRGQLVTDASVGTTLEVSQIPVPAIKERPRWQQVFPTESVSFSCGMERDSSNWIYTWYKDGKQVQADGSVSFDANEAKLSISSASANHEGQYKCSGQLQNRAVKSQMSSELSLMLHGEKPTLTLTKNPDYQVMFPGESVTFSCAINVPSDWQYMWYKDGIELPGSSDKLLVKISATADGGSYTCKARRGPNPGFTTDSSKAIQLQVRGEKPTLTLTQDPEYQVMFSGESVTFSCAINVPSDWQYMWYKDGIELPGSSDKHLVKINRTADGGSYTCKAKRGPKPGFTTDSSKAIQLQVRGEKPKVTLVQNPKHDLMHSGDSVSFNCHVNVSTGWEYLWYKDGRQLGSSGNDHNISSVMTTDFGSYTCTVKRGRRTVFYSDQSNSVKLKVVERPKASIVLLTGWSEVFSTDSLVLKCEVMESTDMWNYTWFKEEEKIESAYSEKHIVTPQNDPDQSMYTCHGIRNERPLYSKTSDSFKTKNLLLKRRVLLSISGCIFFGIIAVFIGCVALRVFRRPAADDDGAEEVNLFPTMAQLKITDAPCPLVDYITDASLNAPVKEEEENGTVCNETTPLPITKQEDQAATNDSQETTETNGGLLSFQT